VCRYYDEPAAVPLGTFHTGKNPFTLVPPYKADPFELYSFAEVYWAEFPRMVVENKHTLEETKQWARTLVERLRMRWRDCGKQGECREQDFVLIGQVLTEMIQTVAVIDRLTFLANRAGLFSFDLRKLLDDFVGDVQIVTEFTEQREKILGVFESVMKEVATTYKNASIYIVAHSEGTVVSLLGLLEAFRDPARPEWAGRVRGMMTIGSPIDKHLLLWPVLFARTDPDPPAWAPDQAIRWVNYFDYGDPIGFELDEARVWLHRHRWMSPEEERQKKKVEREARKARGDTEEAKNEDVFEFRDGDDFGFSRYPLPGQAHIAYWQDADVFEHFLTNVVAEDIPYPSKKTPKPKPAPEPKTIVRAQLVSSVLPYLLVTVLLGVAAYVLFKSVAGVMDPEGENPLGFWMIARNVAGVTALLIGITVAARIPRLTRDPFWRSLALGLGVLCALLYIWAAADTVWFQVVAYGVTLGWLMVFLSLVHLALVYYLGIRRPHWGLRPLVILGTIGAAGAGGFFIYADRAGERLSTDVGSLWPFVLAILAFLYLWWLAALLFDLAFVWHLYIRRSKALAVMDHLLGGNPPRSAWTGNARNVKAT
ncbi:MAG: hypothetical protein WKF67_14360, partial [Rubrobacteraceae bacterium]